MIILTASNLRSDASGTYESAIQHMPLQEVAELENRQAAARQAAVHCQQLLHETEADLAMHQRLHAAMQQQPANGSAATIDVLQSELQHARSAYMLH